MTGNDKNDERTPSPPETSQSPPMRRRHYQTLEQNQENMLRILRVLENAPTVSTPYSLSSISGVDVYLRDLPTVRPDRNQGFSVNVIRPEPQFDATNVSAITNYWADRFGRESPGFRNRWLEAIKAGYRRAGSGRDEDQSIPGDNLTDRSGGEEHGSQSLLGDANTNHILPGGDVAANSNQSASADAGEGHASQSVPGNAVGNVASRRSTSGTPSVPDAGGTLVDHGGHDGGMQQEGNSDDPQPTPHSTERVQTANATPTTRKATPRPAVQQEGNNNHNARPPPSAKPAPTTKSKKKSATPKQPPDQTRSESCADSSDYEANVVTSSSSSSPSSDSDSDSIQQQTARTRTSKSGKKPQVPVSKSPTRQRLQAPTPTPAPNRAGPMAPPPLPPRLLQSENQNGSQEIRRAASTQPMATSSNVQAPRQTRAASVVPTTDRKTRFSSADVKKEAKDATPAEAVQPNIEVTHYLDSKGKRIRGCERHEGDLLTKTVFQTDPKEIEKENARKRRESKQAGTSAAVKRTASAKKVESPSERPAKKVRRQDLTSNSVIDRTVQADEPVKRPTSLTAQQPGDNDFDDDDDDDDDDSSNDHSGGHDDNDDDDDEEHERLQQQRGEMRQFIVDILMGDEGKRVTIGDLLEKLKRNICRNPVPEKDFRVAVDSVVSSGIVQSSGVGSSEELWIGKEDGGGDEEDASGDENENDDDNSDSYSDGDGNGNGNIANKSGKKKSFEDGLAAHDPEEAYIFRDPINNVVKSGGSHHPTKITVDRRAKPGTSWVSPIGGEVEEASESGPVGDNEFQDVTEAEEQKAKRRQAKQGRRQGPQEAGVVRGSNRQQKQPEAPRRELTQKRKTKTDDRALAEEDSEDEDGNQPPTKKARKSTQNPTRSKEARMTGEKAKHSLLGFGFPRCQRDSVLAQPDE